MLKRLYRPVLLLCAAALCSAGLARAEGGLRAVAGLPEAEARVPEAAAAVPALVKGDFSGIPPYSFAYLNDLNTKLIDAANISVDAAIFSMTMKDNPDALLRARDRGARVRVLVDEMHVYPKADAQVRRLLGAPGVEVRTLRGTKANGVNHNKVLVCDGAAAALGSYNWTFGATFSNVENTMVVQHPVYVDGYVRYFDWMWSRARTPAQGPSPELPEGHYGAPPQDPAPAQSFNGLPVPAYLFSPGSRTEERLAAFIDASARSLDVVTFTFSSKILADAVIRAHKRGVKVRFLMDINMGKVSGLAKLVFASGVEFRWRGGRNEKGALHDKFAIMDGKLLETGSFNWTVNASRHSFENVALVTDQGAIAAYQAEFDYLYSAAASPKPGDFDTDTGD